MLNQVQGLTIVSNSGNKVTTNFLLKEFYSTSFNRPSEHYIPTDLINAIQKVREYAGVPIKISSSFRTPEHQKALNAAGYNKAASVKGSPHARFLKDSAGKEISSQPITYAIDFQCSRIKELCQQVADKGEFYTLLREAGIKGIGIYDTFIHIDMRPDEYFTQGLTDEWGKVQLWDYRKKKVKA